MATSSIKRLLLFITFSMLSKIAVHAQKNTATPATTQIVSLAQQLKYFYNIEDLPLYFGNTTLAQISSYDTTGGNDDGFDGTYSFVRKDKDSNLVIFDIKGCGVINRISTPTPTNDTLDFYIDDMLKPAFSIKYTDLFSGKVYPFIKPLCGNELGGYYCYLPIPFQTRCKIVCRARKTQFHQIQYRLYSQGTTVKSFSPALNSEERNSLSKIADLWNKETLSVTDFYTGTTKIISSSKTYMLHPGETKTIFEHKAGGRVTGINIGPATAFEGLQKMVDIRITWDDEQVPAVYCPVADFFGYAFGSASMQSLLLGAGKNENYCYIPMPFDKSAKIELIYRSPSPVGDNKPIRVNAGVSYTEEKRDAKREGKFYTCWKRNELAAYQPAHVFLDTKGRGHYIGSVLQAQGIRPGMTYFFEGDDSTATDGVFRIHGTGSEDYFNGGWYAFPDRWSRKMSLPLHGALDYSLPFCRTGGYRFYMTDKISFEKNIYQSIEHGPVNNNIPVDYTSLALYYCDKPPIGFVKPANELSRVIIPDTLVMFPQLMDFTVWDNISVKTGWMYDTGGESFIFSGNDESRVKISLHEIPFGKYKLLADFSKTEQGCQFSLWQGQTPVSEWIDTYKTGKEERQALQFIGNIDVKEFSNTLTVQFKTHSTANSLLLSRLMFVLDKK